MYSEGETMKGTKKEIHINDKVIYYTHIEKGSSTVCFMFSGQDIITISRYFIMQRC